MHSCLPRLAALLSLLLSSLAIPANEPVDTTALFAVDPLRLTRDVEPMAQTVELTLDPAKDDYSGRVLVDLVAHKDFQSFQLHSLGPVFATATLSNQDGQVTPLTTWVGHKELGLVTLTAPRELGAGQYRLTIEFTGRYARDGLGLYKTVSRGEPYLFTQFQDTHARQAFPCWDEPSFKIPWQLTLTVPAGLEAVTNAAVAYETRGGDWKTIHFGRTPPMQSYIVALAVGPLEFVPVPGLGVPGRIVTPKGQTALAAEAVKFAPPILAALEEYFGIPYPYAKLDQIAVPEYVYGGMENAGLISYTDRVLLVDPEKPSFSQRRSLASIMAHEFAHMWFGDLVTFAWWDDFWLNESTADWIADRIVAHLFPELKARVSSSLDVKRVMRTDALPSVTAVKRRVTAETDLAQLADDLSYNKGKGVLTMVENWIGPAQFRAAMRAYFLKHSWGNTVANDLWAAFSATSGEDITSMLAGFIERPGVPLVTFTLEADGKLRLTQRRFHNLGDPPLPGQWQIPVVLAWGKDGRVHRERILLKDLEQVVNLPGLATADWIYPNAGESGYYRWSLSPDLNARLARRVEALPALERIGLLDNTSALFSAGLIDGNDYLAYLTAFGRDLDPDVNSSVIASIGGLDPTFISNETRPSFHAYQRAILRPILDRIGLRPVAGEPPELGPLRVTLYATLGYEVADPAIVAECRRLAALFLENPSKVEPALRATALGITAYHGDGAFFATMQTAFERAATPSVRSATLAALGRFRDPAIAAEALAYALTPAVNSTEFLGVVLNVGGIRELRPLAIAWVMANYDAIAAKAPPEYTAGLIRLASASEPEEFNRLRDFLLAPGRKTEFAAVNITKTEERLTQRLRLRAKEQANVLKYLQTFPAQPPKD